jgi:hypothetical protein
LCRRRCQHDPSPFTRGGEVAGVCAP